MCGKVSGDVRKMDDCKRVVDEAVKQFGRLDILVNCAAGKSALQSNDTPPTVYSTRRSKPHRQLTLCYAFVAVTASCVRLRI